MYSRIFKFRNFAESRVACPAEFRDTEFRRNFADFFPGILPEKNYGIPYFLRNSVCTEFRKDTEFLNAEFRILRNSVNIRNSVLCRIP